MSAHSQERTFLDMITNGTSSMILLVLGDMELPGTETHIDMTRHVPRINLRLDWNDYIKQYVVFTQPVDTLRIARFVREDTQDVTGIDDMKGRTVCVDFGQGRCFCLPRARHLKIHCRARPGDGAANHLPPRRQGLGESDRRERTTVYFTV